MSESQTAPESAPPWVPLKPMERRILGVMVEKAKTTPEYYPMTLAAIVTACNQKSNRDPVTNYDQDDVEETLHNLRKKTAVILVEGSGRVARWKHTLYDWPKASYGRGPAAWSRSPTWRRCKRFWKRWRRGAWCITFRRPARSAACSSRM